MFCPKCGTQNPDDAKFCAGCGNPMSRPAVAPAATQAPTSASTSGVNAAPANASYGAPKKGISPKLVMGACAVLAVLLVVFLITRVASCAGGGSGYGSATEAAEALGTSVQKVYEGALDGDAESAVNDFASTVVNGIQPDVLEAAMKNSGFSSKEEVLEKISESMPASSLESSMSAFKGIAKVNLSARVGNALSQSEIEDLQDSLAAANIDVEIKSGYEILFDTEIELTSDLGNYKAGETESLASGSSIGVNVVEVDGRWYYWPASVI